jgi:hypothetical protein
MHLLMYRCGSFVSACWRWKAGSVLSARSSTGSVRLELSGLVLVGVGSIIATLPAVFGLH